MGIFKDYDVVVAKKTLNSRVLKGVRGTILITYDLVPPQYEVEFVDEYGDTLDVLTVKEEEIVIEDR